MPPKPKYQGAKTPKIREVFDKNPIACDRVRSGRWMWDTELKCTIPASEWYARNRQSKTTVMINVGAGIKGWYEHISDKPIYIESKAHLKRECDKRGLFAQSIMKPKSRGEGYENRA